MKEYLSYLGTYEIVPEADKVLYDRKTSSIVDPARRRELKIKQYQKEKELRAKIEVCTCRIRPITLTFTRTLYRPSGNDETWLPLKSLARSSSSSLLSFLQIHQQNPQQTMKRILKQKISSGKPHSYYFASRTPRHRLN